MQRYKANSDKARLDALRNQHIGMHICIAKLKTKASERKIKRYLRRIDEINQQKRRIVEGRRYAKI